MGSEEEDGLLERGISPRRRGGGARSRKQCSCVWCTWPITFLLLYLGGLLRSGGSPAAPIVLKGGGLEMHVLPRGAIIQRLYVPDQTGRLDDVVLVQESQEAAKRVARGLQGDVRQRGSRATLERRPRP